MRASSCLVLIVLLAACDGAGRIDDLAHSATGGPGGAMDQGANAPPAGIGRCQGARPGALIETDKGFCTANFLFRDSSGNDYLGSAGHCIIGETPLGGEDAGEQIWRAGQGPEVRDGGGQVIGRFVYAVLSPPKDFSLIRLEPGIGGDPQMCHFGGPTGINEDNPSGTVVLQFYGQGTAIGELVPARTAIAQGMPDDDEVFANGASAPGDSGAGVTDSDGRAIGVLVTGGVHIGSLGTSGVAVGDIGIGRLMPQLERARRATGIRSLRIVTAPAL